MLAERDAWVVLASVPGLGPLTFIRLLREHGSAARVVELAASEAGREVLRDGPARHAGDAPDRDRLPAKTVDALGRVATDAENVLGQLASAGLTTIVLDDPDYPPRLRGIEEPPLVLFVEGSRAAICAERSVALVGTRHPTEGGRRIAARIADALARAGAVVVSGLAVGIDGAAHAAVVATGLPTVAVIGSGHGRLFPAAHRTLARAIVASGGAIASESPPDSSPTKGTFPRRNRIISGLAESTVVVEAAARSGALITARWALEQGRGCFLVPGSIEAPASAGCLGFLREFPGEARIVAGVAELLDDLGLVAQPAAGDGADGAATDDWRAEPAGRSAARPRAHLVPSTPPPSLAAVLTTLGQVEARVASALVAGAVTVDELVTLVDLPVATVLGTLTLLELRGLVAGAYGRYRPAGVLAAAPAGLP